MISVIIPVYNVKQYVRECLESVRNQSYTDFETVLVDDGSTDGSERICEEFCHTDSRFHLIRQKRAGLGSARNAGIEAAKGDFVCFIDSDDIVNRDYLRVLYDNLVHSGADISLCAYERFTHKLPEHILPDCGVKTMNRMEFLDAFLKEPENIVVAWNKLVSRAWLGDLRFRNVWHEDQFMINEYIRRCGKAVMTAEPLYYYRERPDSIMGGENREDTRHSALLDAVRERIRYFYKPEYASEWNALFLDSLIDCMTLCCKTGSRDAVRLFHELFREYARMGALPRNLYMGMKLCAFRICPNVYGKLKKTAERRAKK